MKARKKQKNELSFQAEIREVKSRKLISLDIENSVRFTTNELKVLDLGKIPADIIVEVRVRW